MAGEAADIRDDTASEEGNRDSDEQGLVVVCQGIPKPPYLNHPRQGRPWTSCPSPLGFWRRQEKISNSKDLATITMMIKLMICFQN